MSPFSLNKRGYGIDHDFSPIISAIDTFDRYFSHHHHFTNYFVPRFDLDEDAQFYYLSGELPGAKVEDVIIEPGENHTLVIHGTTHCQSSRSGDRSSNTDSSHEQEVENSRENQAVPVSTETPGRVRDESHNSVVHKPSPTSSHLPMHHGHNVDHQNGAGMSHGQAGMKVLLSERLVGDFNRTFAFPTPIVEEGIRATMENGVLSLLIPKRVKSNREEGRRIPIVQGN